jgi:hypothetical protein
MSHVPNHLDIKTDLRRSIMASFSEKGFKDANAKVFLKNAEENLKKVNLDRDIYLQVVKRLKKAKDTSNIIAKRREDILTASLLI